MLSTTKNIFSPCGTLTWMQCMLAWHSLLVSMTFATCASSTQQNNSLLSGSVSSVQTSLFLPAVAHPQWMKLVKLFAESVGLVASTFSVHQLAHM
jgi:hypothetical protein